MSAGNELHMSLNQVLRGVVETTDLSQLWDQVAVSDLTVDSRKVQPGACFIAYPGHHADGRRFIENAIEAGAGSVIAEKNGLEIDASECSVALVSVHNVNDFLPVLANNFFHSPSEQLALFAVTGTNGKTSVSQMVAAAATHIGKVAGVIGTLGNGLYGALQQTQNTTPDVIETNRLLRTMLDDGAGIVAMEMSSHGLVQGRCDGLTIHTALISNISRDHLDYHHTMEAYRDAKGLLAENPTIKNLILNADDPMVISLAERAKPGVKVLSFSVTNNEADIYAEKVEFRRQGISLQVAYQGQVASIESPLIGGFNGSNLLAATAALIALGFDLNGACESLSKVEAIPGRMERVGRASDLPTVVVDFAHTPDAIEKVLSALRHHCTGTLWCVFGCGGERDAGKRPLMAETASQLADEIVITADNPRSEKFNDIVAQMVKGIPHGFSFQIIESREQAVSYAIANAKVDDVVLLAGKGHEDYQEIAGQKLSYSDLVAARRALDHWRQQGAPLC